ncbi:MAG TPA: MOSC N-terminal beta barrel domain-containing protein [Chthoniobacterales bacterium]
MDAATNSTPHVTGLYIYPVKGCRGLSLTESQVDELGLVHDRRFVITDETGKFLTQRQIARMALIETRLTPDTLVLSANGSGSIEIPLARTGEECTVTVWRDTILAGDQGNDAVRWLTSVLGQPCRLAKIIPRTQRIIPAERAASLPEKTGHPVSFADAFPFLLISEESLADLNHRLDQPLAMNRFRPNIVVANAGTPFAEDTWTRFQIGAVIFYASGDCDRCVVTTTDQETAQRGKEPLRTLAQYRRDSRGEVVFGQNLIHETKIGSLKLGDPVVLL